MNCLGYVHFPDTSIYNRVIDENLAPISMYLLKQCCTFKDVHIYLGYVDDDNKPTEVYPFNPNGSVGKFEINFYYIIKLMIYTDGIAALCSKDGRHLAMMPHPERCFVLWQWPWLPEEWFANNFFLI